MLSHDSLQLFLASNTYAAFNMHATTFVHACECHHQKHVLRLSVWFDAALEPSVYLLERPTARNDLLDGILNDEREREAIFVGGAWKLFHGRVVICKIKGMVYRCVR